MSRRTPSEIAFRNPFRGIRSREFRHSPRRNAEVSRVPGCSEDARVEGGCAEGCFMQGPWILCNETAISNGARERSAAE